MRHTTSWILVGIALAAPVSASAQEYYADIRPVLVEKCIGCHAETGIGWSMEDPEVAYAERNRIVRAVLSGQMPPWLAEGGHQRYADDLSLNEDVLRLVEGWRDAGYPKGIPRPDPENGNPSPLDFTADLSIDVLPTGSYLPAQDMDDDYRCFVVDWEAEKRGYVTGFRAVPGNLNVVHHVVVHAVEPEMIDRYKELDVEVEGPGYECFGGALPTGFDWDAYEERYPDGRSQLDGAEWWLTHWAPGMNGHHFPEGTGILMEPGSGLVVQIHYYTKEARGEADADTHLEFQMEDRVERPAFHLVQTRNAWLDGEENGSMVIPPNVPVTYTVDVALASWLPDAAYMAGVDAARIRGFEVHSANIHMHAFGHSGQVTLSDPHGKTEVLLSIPRWNLHWQRDFVFDEAKTFMVDELEDTSLRVSCTYLNRGQEVAYGGFGSYDEMCFNFSYVALELEDAPIEAGRLER